MPAKALIAQGFGFSLPVAYIPTLGMGAFSPSPPPVVVGIARLREVLDVSLFSTPTAAKLEWADLVIASTPYATAKAKLYTNDFTPTADTLEADYTEADFGGYAEKSITWEAPYIDGAGLVHAPGNVTTFLCTGSPGNDIYGYYVIGAGGEYLGGARFDDAPRPVPGAGFGVATDVDVIL